MTLPSPTRACLLSIGYVLLGLFAPAGNAGAVEWQWSVPDGNARVYLWVPPACQRVRGVVLANHNMIEQGILEHPTMRQTLGNLGFAEVWAVPALDGTFDFHQGAGEHFERIMTALAEQSGYGELRFAPVVPLGHSACATFPWNFAAWNPGRTLAVLSVHGDAPQTTLTGNGKPPVDWGDRNIDGVPGLMVMGEYEWGEERLSPALDFVAKHPKTPLAFLGDAGRGHFDYADRTVEFLARFIEKAAAQRLPAEGPLDQPVTLKPVDPKDGWQVDRWRREQAPTAAPAPYDQYTGNAREAFWCFDQEMAAATETIYAGARGKKPQLLSVTDGNSPVEKGCGEPVTPRFLPLADGITFQLETAFMETVPGNEHNRNPARWATLPAGSPLGHAAGESPISLARIVGPVMQTGPGTFTLCFGRAEYTPDRRNNDLWIVASQPGDRDYKSIVQQAMVHASPNKDGVPQRITFAPIPDQPPETQSIKLDASADSGMPVHYYVREGPAEIDGETLKFTAIPPRTKYPVQVTVVAWQFGRLTDPQVQTAVPVERTFHLVEDDLPGKVSADVSPDAIRPKLPASGLDMIVLGSLDSERTHDLSASRSDTTQGLLGEPARRLLPLEAETWEGGKLTFKMKVDPKMPNYFTVRCSGDEANENYLVLFCEGKQVGYRHLGDIDVLALPDEAPRYNGRFYYVTTPLPPQMTQGKSEVQLEIRSTGPISGYSSTFEQYQKKMVKPSRGIYRLYTHTDGAFEPAADEKQGHAPLPTPRTEPGPEAMEQAKEQVNKLLDSLLASTKPINQMQAQFLARAYVVSWTRAYESPVALERIVAAVDELYRRWKLNPAELWQDKATWNPGWFGVGPAADAVRRTAKLMEPSLAQELDAGTPRREAWSKLFQASRDWLRGNRRWLTNQAMFTDVNLYLSNRGVAAVEPSQALPEEKALDYLYQSVGLIPWLGSDTPNGPEKPFGSDFHQVTQKGLTRERGYAGGYGEGGVEGTMEIYEATRGADGEGDPRIKAQLIKMLRARGPFRSPMLDDEGHPAMRLETAIGWRDTHLPGNVLYAERGGGEHTVIQATAATLDPVAIGYVQQMFRDNQFFRAVSAQTKTPWYRSTVGLLDLPDQYSLLKAQPQSPHRLPMNWDQPDFVFSDEEDGVIAIKNGRDILYASLYWRAGYGVNGLARTHYITPEYEQVAVVREDVIIDPGGQTYKRPDWINFGFGNGGTNIRYPAGLHQASAGEELPIARIPEDVRFKPGDESHYAGKADFYTLRYGNYLIAMNTTKDRAFDLEIPATPLTIQEMAPDRRELVGGSIEKVGPRSTLVLFFSRR